MSDSTSVITIHKGRPAHLQRLIEGLSRCNFKGDLVIVEMNGLTPLPAASFQIMQIEIRGQTLPLAAARNEGRRAAAGQTLVFLDVDCIPGLQMISTLVDALIKNDSLVCARVRYLQSIPDDRWTEPTLQSCSSEHSARVFPPAGLIEAEHPGLFWSLAFAVRAETFDSLAGFDERFEGYGAEDTDLGFRAHNAGLPIMLSADAVAFHQKHETFDPPVQHFADIMRNAGVFRARHKFWPMQGWLDGFERLGLVKRVGSEYEIARMPTEDDIKASRTTAY